MGDRQVELADLSPGTLGAQVARQDDGRYVRLIANLDVSPGLQAVNAYVKCSHDCHLTGPRCGIVLGCPSPAAAKGDFSRCEDAANEQFVMSLDHLGDSQTFDNLRSHSHNIHGQAFFKPHATWARRNTSAAFLRATAAPSPRICSTRDMSLANSSRRARGSAK